MPAPTALVKAPEATTSAPDVSIPDVVDDLEMDPDADLMITQGDQDHQMEGTATKQDVALFDEEGRPIFAPIKDVEKLPHREARTVPIPPHRFTPLRQSWPKLYTPLVEHLKLQVRVNVKRKAVDLRTSKATTDPGALQKGADFIKAFALGFRVEDAVALLRLDNLWIETFEVKDVRTLNGDHLARAIGRIAGKDGKTKFAIENTSRTRIVLADSKIHILGEFQAIHIARESIVSLILGKTPSKVYGGLRTVAARMKERF
jgi:RNA-binding protein PNO1